jgi:peptidoglycan/LPS O-acetylase OafA/YrhL
MGADHLTSSVGSARGGRAAFRLGYRPWLDGLRGVAILLVLGVHLHLLPAGYLGVDLFFVLSGFLITTLLVEEWQRTGTIHFRRFYLRRLLRLGPALLLVCGLCLLATWLLRPNELGPYLRELRVTLCYASNWPTLHHVPMPTLGFTWSLAIEEQFYLVWPALLYGLLRARLRRRWVLLVVVVGAAAAALLRAWLYCRLPAGGPERSLGLMRLYVGLDTRADALLVGCFVGLLAAWNLLPRSPTFRRRARGAAVAVALAFLAYESSDRFTCWHPFNYTALFLLAALAAATLLVGLLVAPPPDLRRILEWRPLVGVGRISYGLYLFHEPVIRFLRLEKMGWEAPGETLLAVTVTVALAGLSFRLVEGPCLRLKSQFGRPAAPATNETGSAPRTPARAAG